MQEQKRVNRVWAIGTEVRRTDVQLLAVVAVGILLILSPLLLVQSSEGALRSAPVPASGTASPLTPAAGTNYPTYLYNLVRTDNVGSQGTVNQYNAHELRSLWNYSAGGAIWSQPIVANGVAYFGAGDGYEYAIGVLNGSLLWKTYVGLDNDTQTCGGAAGPGVTSTATFSSGRIYVSGGDSVFYALNATTGRVYWQLPIGGTIAQGFYLWASPLIYNHSAYVGIASQCGKPRCPLASSESRSSPIRRSPTSTPAFRTRTVRAFGEVRRSTRRRTRSSCRPVTPTRRRPSTRNRWSNSMRPPWR